MEQFITKDQLKEYLILPKNFDWDLVDQENGFAEVFVFFPKEIYNTLKNEFDAEKKEIYRLITKAGVYYSFILSISKLKVHISNFGVQQVETDKLKVAPWWDVRDLGLSLLKLADRCLSDAITKAAKIPTLKSQMPFFNNIVGVVCTPEEFQKIYSINYSPKVFLLLQKFIENSMLLQVNDKVNEDCITIVKTKPNLLPFLKAALVYYSLYYASLLPGFVFTQNAVVIQYDELPWQKSIVLDDHSKLMAGQNFLQLGDDNIKIITNYIKKNLSDFPCYKAPEPDRKIQARPSGIYLT